MRLEIGQRKPGEVPIGALLMTPLFGLPLGAYLVERELIDFGVCGMKRLFGIPCLSCGATRATVRLLHGDILGAVALQPMIMLIYAVLLVWGSISLWAFVRRRSVRLRLAKWQDVSLKLSLLLIPLMNWVYLYYAGV